MTRIYFETEGGKCISCDAEYIPPCPVEPMPPKRGKWHRVEDEMPEGENPVLVKSKDYAYPVTVRWSNMDSCWYSYPSTGINLRIAFTHWRDLPKPPGDAK